jgi:Icc-related predicted phosphoesterase
VYLFDNSYTFNGVKFYGTPWIASLTNWAFYKNEEDLEKAYKNIPKKVDVLITHMPSATAYTGDVLQHGCFNTMTSYGSYQLSNAILDRKIKWAICGHVHSGNHRPENVNGTNFVNVSIKDEDYKVSYEPFVFEV